MCAKKNGNGKAFEDLKCVWMSSGVAGFKLCSLNFDCEHCEFDKAIKNCPSLATAVDDENFSPVDEAIRRIKNNVYEPKSIYLKNQLMVKHLFANTYYLGLNPNVLLLLDNVSYIKDGGHDGFIIKNQAVLRIEGEWGFITVSSPLNFILLDKLAIDPEDLHAYKWFAIIGVNPAELATAQISKEEWIANQSSSLIFLNNYKNTQPAVGPTLLDGGAPIKFLNRCLGNSNYLKLLSKLFID